MNLTRPRRLGRTQVFSPRSKLLAQIKSYGFAQDCPAGAQLTRQGHAVIVWQIEAERGIEFSANQSFIRWRDCRRTVQLAQVPERRRGRAGRPRSEP